MNIKYIIVSIIIGTLAFSYHHFKSPKYVGDWENENEKQKLTILENKIVIYRVDYSEFPNLISYGDWSEITKDEILIRYKLLNTDEVATFKSSSGNVGYFNNSFRTIVFTRVEN